MRALPLLLLLLATPALALDQSQIQSACYTDCEKETGSNPEYKACLARAADMARRYGVFTDIAAAMAPLWPRIEALQDIP